MMSWLSAATLEQAVNQCANSSEVRRAFRGVYPHNHLPTTTTPVTKFRLPCTLIVNTDTHNLPGRHWISIYIDIQRHGEIFDSLMTPPSAHVIRFMERYCQRWTMNHLIYQHPLSSYCGVYVLLHVLQRHAYDSLGSFCRSHFTSSLTDNDHLMRDYYRKHLFPCLHPPPPATRRRQRQRSY